MCRKAWNPQNTKKPFAVLVVYCFFSERVGAYKIYEYSTEDGAGDGSAIFRILFRSHHGVAACLGGCVSYPFVSSRGRVPPCDLYLTQRRYKDSWSARRRPLGTWMGVRTLKSAPMTERMIMAKTDTTTLGLVSRGARKPRRGEYAHHVHAFMADTTGFMVGDRC
jgi:hypothetical protein